MTSDTAAGTAPSPDRRVLRGELAQAVGPLSTPQLRTGAWTRFGGERTLGDPVTEDVLSALAETTRTAARAQGYATGWAEGRREAAAEAAANRAELEALTREAEARRQAEHEQALAALQRAVTVRLAPHVASHPDVAALSAQGITVVADAGLEPHDALLETTAEAVDLRISTALARVREALS